MANFSLFFLDRPEAGNALDGPTAKNLERALKEAVKNKQTGFIIASSNPRVFCGGGDVRAASKMKTKAQGINANRQIRKILQSFKQYPLMIVAAIEGEVVGGGCELALACDWIIASHHGGFSFKQVTLSLSPGWGGAARLLKRVSSSRALDWLTSGRRISAQEACNEGLIDALCAENSALEAAESFLEERAQTPPELIERYKKLIFDAQSIAVSEVKLFESLWWAPPHRKFLSKIK